MDNLVLTHTLRHPYPRICQTNGYSYGGAQSWFSTGTLKAYGCGLAASADVILYLQKHAFCTKEAYLRLVTTLQKKYMPVLPRAGLNAYLLAFGLWRYLRSCGIRCIVRFGVRAGRRFEAIDRMLDRDIPVILSIGPNLPFFWQKHKLRLYTHTKDGALLPVKQTAAHYVIVTGSNADWLQAATWGQKLYIRKSEYLDYVKKHSLCFVNSIVYIDKI